MFLLNFRFEFSLSKYIMCFDSLILYTLSEVEVLVIQKESEEFLPNRSPCNVLNTAALFAAP